LSHGIMHFPKKSCFGIYVISYKQKYREDSRGCKLRTSTIRSTNN
jgi:hypothetical protein